MDYRDKEWLSSEYENSTQTEIAEKCGASLGTITRWLKHYNIIEGGDKVTTSDCESCGESFAYYPSQRSGRYCSRACYLDGLNAESCDECGEQTTDYKVVCGGCQ